MSNPIEPGSKGGGASADAAKQIVTRASMLRSAIENLMAKGYRLTADQIADHLKESVLAIRPRCSELVKSGTLVKTEDRRKNASGMTAHVLRHRDALIAVELPKPEPKRPTRIKAPAVHADQNALFG
ncbi:hypothetical protein [Bradyrhizobium sp. SZCCHNR1075]|uniref:hypothetical protein n=1 Tax=Bradyrhizobium sp. SZCCHNR1075 TaxID=3057362 RepID=UPI0028EBBCCA|nr:hypothetical protein [Bradyrhizobium sp. SZCCHNR1075]